MSNISKLSIIFAGEDIVARYLDGGTLLIRVRAMPVRHLARVLQLADKEAELIDYVCVIPREDGGGDPVSEGFADNLADESHLELYEAAKRLNFSRAASWAERQIAAKQFTNGIALKAQEVMQPIMDVVADSLGETLKPVLKQIAASLDSASKSPSTSAAPSINSSTATPSAS